MESPDAANANEAKLAAESVFDLVRLHLKHPLVLSTAAVSVPEPWRVGADDPRWVAGELLRLALIGAIAEGEHPDAPVSLVLRFADHMLQRSR